MTDPSLPTAAKGDLVAAIAESLRAIENDYREEMRELRALLEEARREAEKDEPSDVKLRNILHDCKEMARTVAALDPVWQGVQRLAKLIGIP